MGQFFSPADLHYTHGVWSRTIKFG